MARLRMAASILEAAEKWKQECLVDGGSLFAEERLWAEANFRELKTYFLERPDTGSGSFEEKLRIQLEPAHPEARRLWAEITWVYYLIVISVTRITKLDRIRTAWEWSGEALPEEHWALGDVLDGGIVNPGMGYFGHQWREFNFIITMMLDWGARSARERESLLSDPWGFSRHGLMDSKAVASVYSAMLCCFYSSPTRSNPSCRYATKGTSSKFLRTKPTELLMSTAWTPSTSTRRC